MEIIRNQQQLSGWLGLRWRVCVTLGLLLWLLPLAGWSATLALEKVEATELPEGQLELRFDFDAPPPLPMDYAIEAPARILLDLPEVASHLDSKYLELGVGPLRNLTVLGANGRTRLVLKLERLVPYRMRREGNTLILLLGEPNSAAVPEPAAPQEGRPEAVIEDVDFRRGDAGEGQVLITLSRSDMAFQAQEQGGRVYVTFDNARLPDALQRRLDVTEFATPIQMIDARMQDGQAQIRIEPQGAYRYTTYQADHILVVEVAPPRQKVAEQAPDSPYRGEKLSLNFRDIDIRSALQIIAKFTDLNLVASDSVQGRITLRLQNVPWDQALDLILRTKGLDKRRMGNVLLVAPTEEIATYERQSLEANKQVEELAPLVSEFIQLRYAKASELARLLRPQGDGSVGLLSSRGRAMVDERTNTLFVQDTVDKLAEVRKALDHLDIPVRQVLIEARIVIARTNLSKELGIRWGGRAESGNVSLGGSLREIPASTSGLSQVALNPGLAVDLGAPAADATSFALGYASSDLLLDLELSALESDGKGEVVSQPKVITADQKTARIQSGTEIPFQEASSSGATTTAFKEAVLSLEVTPQITPDNRIIMDLNVNQDSVAELTVNGAPAIDTNSIETQVLVENGETVVLGGIFTSEVLETVAKTPFFGDLPYIGALFRRTERSNEKVELLVFITPKLIDDSLTAR